MYKLAGCNNLPRFDAEMQSLVFRTFTKQNNKIYNIIIIANEAAELRSDNSLCRAVYWKIAQICVTLLCFVHIWVYLGSDVIPQLLLAVQDRVIQCVSVGRGL